MWKSAFYSKIYPREIATLMKYGEIVRELARLQPGTLTRSMYDQKFRALRETRPIPWDELHYEY